MKIADHQAGCSTTCLAYLMCAKMGMRLHFKLLKSGSKSFVSLLCKRVLQQSHLYISTSACKNTIHAVKRSIHLLEKQCNGSYDILLTKSITVKEISGLTLFFPF